MNSIITAYNIFFILFTFREDVNPEENKLKTDDVTEEMSNGKIEEVTTM